MWYYKSLDYAILVAADCRHCEQCSLFSLCSSRFGEPTCNHAMGCLCQPQKIASLLGLHVAKIRFLVVDNVSLFEIVTLLEITTRSVND